MAYVATAPLAKCSTPDMPASWGYCDQGVVKLRAVTAATGPKQKTRLSRWCTLMSHTIAK